ncbi:HTH_Tnp_Tc3_2 domain-containing protein [Trichonephila clavipes]|nr:HTH_Tnp_Tc3_2 domain-containing protein [Trichonephila clavipes]
MGFCAAHRRVQIYNGDDSGRLLIWREQRTRYHQSNTVERHSYRGGGILVWAGSRSVATLTCMCSMEEL